MSLRLGYLINFLLGVVEESWEVLESPIVEDSLGLIIRTSHDIANCSKSRCLHFHFPET